MLDLSAVRAGLKDHLQQVNGGELNVYATPVSQPDLPAAVIGFPTVEYNVTVNGLLSAVTLNVTVFTSAADLGDAVTRMDEYMGQISARSIQQAIVSNDGRSNWSGIAVNAATGISMNEDLGAISVDFHLIIQA